MGVYLMKLTILGSGSSGNCYLLHNEKECLVVEAGIPFVEVKKALDFDISKIVGVIVSHEHKDHSKYVSDYHKVGIPVFKPYEIVAAPINNFGNFEVRHFGVVHDVQCYGFLITHKEIGRLLFATDTEYIKYRFKGLNHVLIEANYSKELISEYHKSLGDRVKVSHMEINTTCDFLESNNNPNLYNVVLLHLSDRTSNEQQFIDRAKQVVNSNVYVATKGIEIDLDNEPF